MTGTDDGQKIQCSRCTPLPQPFQLQTLVPLLQVGCQERLTGTARTCILHCHEITMWSLFFHGLLIQWLRSNTVVRRKACNFVESLPPSLVSSMRTIHPRCLQHQDDESRYLLSSDLWDRWAQVLVQCCNPPGGIDEVEECESDSDEPEEEKRFFLNPTRRKRTTLSQAQQLKALSSKECCEHCWENKPDIR